MRVATTKSSRCGVSAMERSFLTAFFASLLFFGCAPHDELADRTSLVGLNSTQSGAQEVKFRSADGSATLTGTVSLPFGSGRFPALVVLLARSCEGPAGIPEPWQQSAFPLWGYATLLVDSFAARGLGSSACGNFAVLQPAQTIGDAYGAFKFLATDPRVDSSRIALVGFGAEGTTAILADTVEARDRYLAKSEPGFRAFFSFYPYCNVEFVGGMPQPYAPEEIFAGERDDMSPAQRCVDLVDRLGKRRSDVKVTVYAGAEAGFDIVPTDANFENRDPTALHPGSTKVSTHP